MLSVGTDVLELFIEEKMCRVMTKNGAMWECGPLHKAGAEHGT
jgi:hypothetical protein